mmetsp:Transcript_2809/g.9494  ORF Transcript_2809/g.9494 Transcript_2809/m.9494 type:complete len:364 (-) Transcript_2809:268-1359(-)
MPILTSPSGLGGLDLDELLARRAPPHGLDQGRLDVGERDRGVDANLELPCLDLLHEDGEVRAVGLYDEGLDLKAVDGGVLPEVGDGDELPALLEHLGGLLPVLRVAHAVVDEVVLLAREHRRPVLALVVDHHVRAQGLHGIHLGGAVGHGVGGRRGGDGGPGVLAELDSKLAGHGSTTKHQKLLPGREGAQRLAREVRPVAGEEGLVAGHASQGEAGDLLKGEVADLHHEALGGQDELRERAAGLHLGRGVAALGQAGVHNHAVAHLEGGVGAHRGHSARDIKAGGVGEGDGEKAVVPTGEELPVDGVDGGGVDLDLHLAVLWDGHGHVLEGHGLDGLGHVLVVCVQAPGLHGSHVDLWSKGG